MKVGHLQVIFKLPMNILLSEAPGCWPKEELAYVEWYRVSRTPGAHHNMYTVSKLGEPARDMVLLRTIRQACQLIPTAARKEAWGSEWTSKNVLDQCNSFLLNNWASKYTYQTIW